MRKKLEIERIIELEKNLNNEELLKNLSKEEMEYVELARKLPYKDLLNVVYGHFINWYLRGEISISRELINKYSCNEIELYRRFVDIERIIKYNEKTIKQDLKKQKEMVKKAHR